MAVLIYVDDLLYSGEEKEIVRFEKKMKEEFTVKETEDIKTYVGLNIKMTKNGFELDQMDKIKAAIKEWDLEDAKEVNVPMNDDSIKEPN